MQAMPSASRVYERSASSQQSSNVSEAQACHSPAAENLARVSAFYMCFVPRLVHEGAVSGALTQASGQDKVCLVTAGEFLRLTHLVSQ